MIDFTKEGRVGDKVRNIEGDIGTIECLAHGEKYPVLMRCSEKIGCTIAYTATGMLHTSDDTPSLMFANGSFTIDQGTPPSRETEELHCGLTEAQWQWVIDGEFLVCFSDKSIEEAKSNAWIAVLNRRMKSKGVAYPFAEENTVWRYAAIPNTKGIRKPHFGGACPTTHDGLIAVKLHNDAWINITLENGCDVWPWRKGDERSTDIMEYIELP